MNKKYNIIIFSLTLLTGTACHGAACWRTSRKDNTKKMEDTTQPRQVDEQLSEPESNTKKIKDIAQQKQVDSKQATLFMAIKNNNIDELEGAIQDGAKLDIPNENNLTPLMKAAAIGNKLAVMTLLGYRADINARNKEGNTALMVAINVHNEKRMITFIQHENGYRLIPWDDEEIINQLLEKKADINAKNSWGNTALMVAAKTANALAVQILLQNGADISLTNNKCKTALDLVSPATKEIKQNPANIHQCLDYLDIEQMLLDTKPIPSDDSSTPDDSNSSASGDINGSASGHIDSAASGHESSSD